MKKINIALVGYGYWGPNLASKLIQSTNFNLLYICDHNKLNLNNAIKSCGNKISYISDFDLLLNQKGLDAIAIAVETVNHFEIVKKALLSKKHVFVEKPLTLSYLQIPILIDITKLNSTILHVDHLMVFHPAIKKIKTIIDQNIIGKVLFIDTSRMNLGRVKEDHGPIWDLTIHDLSIIDFLLPNERFIDSSEINNLQQSSQNTISSLNVTYDSFIANLRSSWSSHFKERSITITGDNGTIVFNDLQPINKIAVYLKNYDNLINMDYKDYVLLNKSGDILLPFYQQEDALMNSINHFYDTVMKKTLNEEALRALRIIKIIQSISDL